jgi:hypothetical protein
MPLRSILPDAVRSKRRLYAKRRPQVESVNAAIPHTNRRSRSPRIGIAVSRLHCLLNCQWALPARSRLASRKPRALRDGGADRITSQPGLLHRILASGEHLPSGAEPDRSLAAQNAVMGRHCPADG